MNESPCFQFLPTARGVKLGPMPLVAHAGALGSKREDLNAPEMNDYPSKHFTPFRRRFNRRVLEKDEP